MKHPMSHHSLALAQAAKAAALLLIADVENTPHVKAQASGLLALAASGFAQYAGTLPLGTPEVREAWAEADVAKHYASLLASSALASGLARHEALAR